MDLEQYIPDSSKRALVEASNLVFERPALYSDFLELTLAGKGKTSARASRVCTYVSRLKPEISVPYLDHVVKVLPGLNDESIIGSFLRLFVELPVEYVRPYFEELAPQMFDYLEARWRMASIHIFSMEMLEKIVMDNPELKNELAIIISRLMPYGQKAFQYRGKRIIKRLTGKEYTEDMQPEDLYDDFNLD